MKRRYLFPLVYIVVDAFALLFFNTAYEGPSLSIPSIFVMRIVSRTIGIPTDPTYFAYLVGVGTILQMFLLGLALELLAGKIHKLLDRKRVIA